MKPYVPYVVQMREIELALSRWAEEYNQTHEKYNQTHPVRYIKLFDMPVEKLDPFFTPYYELMDRAERKRIKSERRRFNADNHGTRRWAGIINCLKRAKIDSIGEIFQRETSDLLKIRGLGEKGVAELLSGVEKMMHQYRKGAK